MKSQQLHEILSARDISSGDVGIGEEIAVLNDKIEKSFMEGILTTDTPSSIKDTAKLLHSALISYLLRTDPLGTQFDLNQIEEQFGCLKSIFETSGGIDFDDNEADRIAICISDAISKSKSKETSTAGSGCDHDEDDDDLNVDDIYTLSQMIRASKNLIRWNRSMVMQMRKSKTNVSGSDSYVSSTERLCSVGMVSLYMHILQSVMCVSAVSVSTSTQMASLKDSMDDLAKQCSLALFHSTFSQAPEPCCKRALQGFVSELNGVEVIARLLVAPTEGSVNLMLCLIKLVHNIVGTFNNATKFDDALATCDTRTSQLEQQHHYQQQSVKLNLFTILVATLAWALRSESVFPSPNKADRRPDLIIEIIRVLFALRSGNSKTVQKMEAENVEMMTQMGVLIVDILKLPHQDQRCYECKLAVLLLLMNTPKDYGSFLVVNNAIEELLAIFLFQLNTIIVEGAGDLQSESNATIILPILIVLNQLVDGNAQIREQVKNYIFPPEDEANFMTKVEEHRQTVMSTPESKRGGKKNMHPLDAPVGTTRWKLINLMTWTESNVKRCASEFLWNICRKDPNQFMLRCGFGNAVHMLGIKGLYKIPK
jgi:hypothetical protein